MPKRGRPHTRPPKVAPLTSEEQAILDFLPVKFGVGRPSNKTKRLLATIALGLLKINHSQKDKNE